MTEHTVHCPFSKENGGKPVSNKCPSTVFTNNGQQHDVISKPDPKNPHEWYSLGTSFAPDEACIGCDTAKYLQPPLKKTESHGGPATYHDMERSNKHPSHSGRYSHGRGG